MAAKPFHVAVIGAGMSGLCVAKQLAERGFSFTVYEKADEVGGTWRENDYPGLYVDIPVSAYQLSFAPKYDWTRAYAPGPEIQRYLIGVADDYGLRQHIIFGVEFVRTTWTGAQWELLTADGRVLTADAVVSATGFLHVPTLPSVPGVESFAGPHFHSSGWPRGLDVTGKRVGVIGSGSSGIQIVSALAYRDCEVVQFVRTPQWIETVDNPELTEEMLERVTREPGNGPQVLTELEDGINQDPRLRNPQWKLSPGPLREDAQQALREDLLVIRDPELRAKLTPDFPPGCKRIPKSPWYYEAVQEPGVTVVRAGVERIEPTGAVTGDGTLYEFDIIVFATGFAGHAYMRPMQVLGLGGASLDEVWADGPFSYRGVAVPGFPNFFLLHGPFSPVNNVPVPKTLDDEIGYICRVLEHVSAEGVAAAPTEAATERFRLTLDEAIPQTVWFSGCDNWYKGHGRTPLIWPWFDTEHEAMFADLALADLEIVPVADIPTERKDLANQWTTADSTN
jgi:cation diffusion facilitator CzcD-associated flavoprotein CzcO